MALVSGTCRLLSPTKPYRPELLSTNQTIPTRAPFNQPNYTDPSSFQPTQTMPSLLFPTKPYRPASFLQLNNSGLSSNQTIPALSPFSNQTVPALSPFSNQTGPIFFLQPNKTFSPITAYQPALLSPTKPAFFGYETAFSGYLRVMDHHFSGHLRIMDYDF
jgi:hypothetical protein